MSNKFHITINREFGSGGRIIGEKVANILGIDFLDKSLLVEAAKSMGTNEDFLINFDEKAPDIWNIPTSNLEAYSGFIFPYYIHSYTNDNLYVKQKDVINKVANDRSAVFIGRCANEILKDRDCVLNIYLYADIKFRCNILKTNYNVTSKNLEKEIKKIDKDRASYYFNYTSRRWDDYSQYDLVINTETLGLDKTAQLIASFAKLKFNL